MYRTIWSLFTGGIMLTLLFAMLLAKLPTSLIVWCLVFGLAATAVSFGVRDRSVNHIARQAGYASCVDALVHLPYPHPVRQQLVRWQLFLLAPEALGIALVLGAALALIMR